MFWLYAHQCPRCCKIISINSGILTPSLTRSYRKDLLVLLSICKVTLIRRFENQQTLASGHWTVTGIALVSSQARREQGWRAARQGEESFGARMMMMMMITLLAGELTMKSTIKTQKGFTLIELMIVVAIIDSIRVKPFCVLVVRSSMSFL